MQTYIIILNVWEAVWVMQQSINNDIQNIVNEFITSDSSNGAIKRLLEYGSDASTHGSDPPFPQSQEAGTVVLMKDEV